MIIVELHLITRFYHLRNFARKEQIHIVNNHKCNLDNNNINNVNFLVVFGSKQKIIIEVIIDTFNILLMNPKNNMVSRIIGRGKVIIPHETQQFVISHQSY